MAGETPHEVNFAKAESTAVEALRVACGGQKGSASRLQRHLEHHGAGEWRLSTSLSFFSAPERPRIVLKYEILEKFPENSDSAA
jgi:hypothetical protein